MGDESWAVMSVSSSHSTTTNAQNGNCGVSGVREASGKKIKKLREATDGPSEPTLTGDLELVEKFSAEEIRGLSRDVVRMYLGCLRKETLVKKYGRRAADAACRLVLHLSRFLLTEAFDLEKFSKMLVEEKRSKEKIGALIEPVLEKKDSLRQIMLLRVFLDTQELLARVFPLLKLVLARREEDETSYIG
jgi:hypothetical protein